MWGWGGHRKSEVLTLLQPGVPLFSKLSYLTPGHSKKVIKMKLCIKGIRLKH